MILHMSVLKQQLRTDHRKSPASLRAIRANHQSGTRVCNEGDSVTRAQDRATGGAGGAFGEDFLEKELLLAGLGQGRRWR